MHPCSYASFTSHKFFKVYLTFFGKFLVDSRGIVCFSKLKTNEIRKVFGKCQISSNSYFLDILKTSVKILFDVYLSLLIKSKSADISLIFFLLGIKTF